MYDMTQKSKPIIKENSSSIVLRLIKLIIKCISLCINDQMFCLQLNLRMY